MLLRPPESLNQSHSAIAKKMDSDWYTYQSIWQVYQSQAATNARLESGDSTVMPYNFANASTNTNNFFFNHTRPFCNMVSGRQIQNRKSSIIVPLENGDQKTADQWTKIIMGIYKRENVYRTISEAFHQGACIAGMNLLQVYLDWSKDPVNGDMRVRNLAFNQFYIDPYFRDVVALTDCNFVWVRSNLTHQVAASLMPEYYDEIMALPGNPLGTGRDGRFAYLPEAFGPNKNTVSYDEYYYRAYRDQKLLVDKVTGETLDVSKEEVDKIKYFLENNPQVAIIEQQVPTVRLAIRIQNHVYYDGMQPLGIDRYPFAPVVGYYNSMMPTFYNRIQSICTSLRDPQTLLNRRIILTLDAMESMATTGMIFMEDSVVDVKHLFQTGAGRVIPLKRGAQMTDVQMIQPPNIPQYVFQAQDMLGKEFSMVTGITEENMGFIVDEQASGFKTALRQSAGNTALEPVFSRLDDSQIAVTEIMMDAAQANYTPGKIKQLLEGDEPAPQFYNKAFGKYHATVELGFDTITQKQMQMAQILEMKKLGINIPDTYVIKIATLQNKDELLQELGQQSQQQAQMQQQQMQLEMLKIQAEIKLAEARAKADEGLGIERVSRVQENQALAVERRAEAVKDHEAARLDRVKAAKELLSMDLTQLQTVLQIMNELQSESQEQLAPA